MKVAIMTDSNSGITQKEAQELGIKVIPMPFMINGEEYFEDINLTQEQFYKLLEDDTANVCTSQPSVGVISSTWDELLKEYDQIVYIPMSSGLSMSCNTARTLAQNSYAGKVFVVDNHRISITQKRSVLDAIELTKQGYDGASVLEILTKNMHNSTIYITVDTLKYLCKGGRCHLLSRLQTDPHSASFHRSQPRSPSFHTILPRWLKGSGQNGVLMCSQGSFP